MMYLKTKSRIFFHKLKQFSNIATRYDKLAVPFLSFIYIAAITILLK